MNADVQEDLEDRLIAQYSEFYTHCQRRYLAIQESTLSNFILESHHKKALSFHDLMNDEFVRNSYNRLKDMFGQVDFSRCHRAIMVGCGAFPTTLFWLKEHYPSINCVGLDMDNLCVKSASQIVKNLHIKGIKILNQNGQDFNFSNIDFIFVANQVSPKRKVLEQIAATSSREAQVVVRNQTPCGRLLAECVRDNLPAEFSIRCEGEENQAFLSMNLFLSRNDVL